MTKDLHTKEDLLIALSESLNANTPLEKRLQLYLMKGLLNWEGQITQDDVDILMDGYKDSFFPRRRVAALLRDCGLFYEEGECFWVKKEIPIGSGLGTPADLLKLFETPLPMLPTQMEYNIVNAIKKGFAWCINIALQADSAGMQGLPAFFTCHKDKDEFIGLRPAGTAVSDALVLMCEGVDYLQMLDFSPETLSKVFVFLIEQTLSLQVYDSNWDKGGFLPMEDQPESAHPTVDATCLAVMALCSLFENAKTISRFTEYDHAKFFPHIVSAVTEGLHFLFRMQLANGGYGIYRFESECDETEKSIIVTSPHENSTRLVLATMGTVKGSGIFDFLERGDFYAECNRVIQRIFFYMLVNMADVEGTKLWLPGFAKELRRIPIFEAVASTARVCRSLRPVWYAFETERKAISEIINGYCQKCLQNFPNANTTSYYNFTSPRKYDYSTFYSWRYYADVVSAYALLEAYMFYDVHLPLAAWELIESTIHHTLRRQHFEHGHWNDPDSKKPFIATTLSSIELLKYYLAAMKKKASSQSGDII
jgi:hypothetical protein